MTFGAYDDREGIWEIHIWRDWRSVIHCLYCKRSGLVIHLYRTPFNNHFYRYNMIESVKSHLAHKLYILENSSITQQLFHRITTNFENVGYRIENL